MMFGKKMPPVKSAKPAGKAPFKACAGCKSGPKCKAAGKCLGKGK